MSDYETESSSIRDLGALPPDQFIDHMSELHNTLDASAPNITPHVHSTAFRAVQYLNSKLPKSNSSGLLQDDIEPSEHQKRHWMDLHQTVSNPLSVLEKVKNNTIGSHHLEALQSVYPDLYQDMKEKALEHIGEAKMKGTHIPYERKLSISKFIGLPLDATMTSQNMQAIINAASPNLGPEAQANAAHKAGKGPSGSVITQVNKVNSLYQTPGQAREARNVRS